MYLHKTDRELLRDMIITVSEKSGIEETIVEKDYYVTLILRELVKRNPDVVFKGGTSLSKAYHIINRFSEDIDITFSEHIGESRRKKVKYKLLKVISEEIGLPISNWDKIESDKDYNHYDFVYQTVSSTKNDVLRPYVKLETAFMSYSYPTEMREITSLLYEFLKDTDSELIKEYGLEPFAMKTQSMERTFIDKLFAVCDYYIKGKTARTSRHLYDIYKLRTHIVVDEELKKLMLRVRKHRSQMGRKIAPSAAMDVDILKIVSEIVKSDFYKKDYEDSKMLLIHDYIPYEEVIQYYPIVMQELFGAENE